MTHFRKSGGFTLVEFVISIAIGSLVMLAATSVLLLGLRIHARSVDVSNQQYTVSILMDVVHDFISEGNVTYIVHNTNGTNETTEDDIWFLKENETGATRLTYENNTIYLGESSALLENVTKFEVTSAGEQYKISENTFSLITVTITTDHGGPYSYTIYAPNGVTIN